MAREQLTGWGGTAPSVAEVSRPTDAAAVAALLADPPPRGVIARGLGRSYGDAAQNAGGVVVTTTGLDLCNWIDRDLGVLVAAAGTSLDTLLRFALPAGWFLPVSPGTRHVTVGGAIAADIHGKNHHRDGSFIRHVVSLTLATSQGVHSVCPESDADLYWATAGGLGLTGIIIDAVIRLLPVATSAVRVVTERGRDLDDVMARMEAGDARHRYSVAWVDGLARGGRMGRGVITWGDHAEVCDLPAGPAQEDPLAFEPAPPLAVPDVPLPNMLNATTVAAFNQVWFHKAPARRRTTVEPIARFFHPLDSVDGWNRLYGRRGFLQYQFVVPFAAAGVVRIALERLRDARCPSFLTVLKRMGEGTPGPLSFPQPGWTLAVDVPAGRAQVSGILDELDDLVAAAGGRVYLAKDSRLRPEMIAAMYPDIERWRAVQRRVDPNGVLTSDLGRRLGLVPPRQAG